MCKCCDGIKSSLSEVILVRIALLMMCAIATVMQYHHHEHDGSVCFLWSENHISYHVEDDLPCDTGQDDDDYCGLHINQLLLVDTSDHQSCHLCGLYHNINVCYLTFQPPTDQEPVMPYLGNTSFRQGIDGELIYIIDEINRRGPPLPFA